MEYQRVDRNQWMYNKNSTNSEVQTLHFSKDPTKKRQQNVCVLNVTWLWDENMQVLVLPGKVIGIILFSLLGIDLKVQ